MGPIDYSMQVLDPIQMALQGYAARVAEGQANRQMGQQDVALNQGQQRIDLAAQAMQFEQQQAAIAQQQAAQQQAQAQAAQQAYVDYILDPNKTAEKTEAVIRANPELADAVMQTWQGMGEQQKANTKQFGMQVVYALKSGNVEAAKSLLDERIAAAETAGNQAEADAYRAERMQIDVTPETVLADAMVTLYGVMDPKEFDEFSGTLPGAAESEEPAAVQALRIRAQEAGLVPGSEEYRNFMMQGGAERGMALEVGPDGTVRMTQGNIGSDPFGGKPPTEGQLAGAGYLQRMRGAEEILADLEAEGIVSLPTLKAPALGTRFEGYVLDEQEQRLEQAKRDWVRAKLRKESGAVIAEEEMAEEVKTYFPVPGDDPKTVAQKRAARIRAERQMEIGAGPAASMVANEGAGSDDDFLAEIAAIRARGDALTPEQTERARQIIAKRGRQ